MEHVHEVNYLCDTKNMDLNSQQHLVNKTDSVTALCDTWLSPTSSKASMLSLSCDSCPSIAHYAQLSQVCLHVAVSSNFEP